ncbi:hypothetical protein M0Q03_02915 [bacterium]|nr:hypothetical protein [bacterium]
MILMNPKFKLAWRIVPVIFTIVVAKVLMHQFGFEVFSLSPLFTAIISANIFLIGFLVSGVLSDYKESEKIPTDISSNIESIADEGKIVYKSKNKDIGIEIVQSCSKMCGDISAWFENKKGTAAVMDDLEGFNDCFIKLEGLSHPPFVARLKGEQNTIRKLINRAHTIKDTNFIGTGYAIAEIITIILISGFIFIKMEPFYEGVFFISFVSFMLIYMIYFIKNLDNPFGYGQGGSVENVSLKPFLQTQRRLDSWIEKNK